VSGCTVHFVVPEIDGGPIIAQAAVRVLARDTADTLATRILQQEHRLYPLVVRWFAEGRLRQTDGRVDVTGVPPGATLLFSENPSPLRKRSDFQRETYGRSERRRVPRPSRHYT
jgi:phosphoribosylglycinamide formyltransferase-1